MHRTTNSKNPPTVGIMFEDRAITEIFSALLEVRGVRTTPLANLDGLTAETIIITEPQFFPLLDDMHRRTCLVVGNKDCLQTVPALHLSRPLTEEKVENALAQFLSSCC